MGGWMKWAKKSGIKLTVYSLQNAVCCSLAIFHDGLSREENRERERERVRSRGGCLTMEPFTQPLPPSQHPYIIIHTEKKPGGTYGSRQCRGLRNFKVPSTHQVLSNATLDFFARLVERSSSCTFDSNKFSYLSLANTLIL